MQETDLVAEGTEPSAFEVVVYGTARPAGSKRAFAIKKGGVPTGKVAVSDDNPKSEGWKNQVAQICGEAWGDDEPLDEPLEATFTFYRMRPKGHYRKGGALSAAGRRNPFPAVRPDLLKLARAIEDAMSKIVYRDDSLIVDEHLYKRWGTPERVEIVIRKMVAVVERPHSPRPDGSVMGFAPDLFGSTTGR